MKKALSMLLSMVLAFSLMVGATGTIVHAEELDTPAEEEDVEEYVNFNTGINVGTSWATIVTASPGINGNIKVNTVGYTRADVRMLGSNGNELWYGEDAIAPVGERTFWCGSDVYTVQIRFHSGTGVVWVGPGT